MNLQTYLAGRSAGIDKALLNFLPPRSGHPAKLFEAMRYAVTSGGKRIRPILALEACRAVGGDEKKVMPAACALELIHNYSLVHDDLPCMDDDALRRGRPTCHVKFGEVTALLAGDALLTLAFKILAEETRTGSDRDSRKKLEVVRWVAEAVGVHGMVGGQALDMEFQGKEMDLPTAEFINTRKSGALIAVSARVGAYLGGGAPGRVERLYRYGKYAGLLFQVVDDIMDSQGYVNVMGLAGARREAERLCDKAKRELAPFGKKGLRLAQIADYVLTREK